MDLKTTPFSIHENKKKYTIISFNEMGLTINFLNPAVNHSSKLSSGNCYKFGVIIDGEYFWYFNGKAFTQIGEVRINRAVMRDIFAELLIANKDTQNIPFVCKSKRT